ncbi:MAG: DUF308 domain-containing protein [Coriobacteriales bacterium]|jgi:uncharacterized membrane protein HdeD (DUF308 family)
MTKLQRIGNLALGLLMIVCALVLLLLPQNGLLVVAFVLAIALVLYGVRKLVYYFRMARHTVGGLSVLFVGVIALDVGVFAIAVIDNPQIAIALYLVAHNALNGFLFIGRGIESKMNKAPWVGELVKGLLCLAFAVACISCVNSGDALLWIFCLGLLYDAGVRLASAFRPSAIVFIQ